MIGNRFPNYLRVAVQWTVWYVRIAQRIDPIVCVVKINSWRWILWIDQIDQWLSEEPSWLVISCVRRNAGVPNELKVQLWLLNWKPICGKNLSVNQYIAQTRIETLWGQRLIQIITRQVCRAVGSPSSECETAQRRWRDPTKNSRLLWVEQRRIPHPRDHFSVDKDYVCKPIKLDNIKNNFKIPSDR